jgi:class 3 adenylate cyclase
MDAAMSLERHGLVGRFLAPAAEADYQRWYALRLRILGAAMGLASIIVWVLVPPLCYVTDPRPDPMWLIYLVCWGINIPALALATLYLRRPVPSKAASVGTLMLSLTATDTLLVLLPTFSDLSPLVYAVTAVFFGMLAPVTQLPLRVALPAAILITAAGEGGAFLVADAGGPDLVIAAAFIPLSTLFIALPMAFVAERNLRDRYVDERVIENQRQLIRRYAPSSVVSRIELGDDSVDHPQRRKVTVFFSDVVGFTQLADRVDPEALADIVNEYLGSLSDLIERHGGTLNEFAGDGVMAIFGAPDDMEPAEQVRAAIAAARELQSVLPTWSAAWYEHGIVADLKARVGINTGTVSVGTFGSAVRATYTGIGLQTNIAARVQAQAAPGGILLSNTSWHLVKDTAPCEPRGEVTVKGVHFPIELYEPVA